MPSSATSPVGSDTGAALLTSVAPNLGSELIDMNSVCTGSLADARRRAGDETTRVSNA